MGNRALRLLGVPANSDFIPTAYLPRRKAPAALAPADLLALPPGFVVYYPWRLPTIPRVTQGFHSRHPAFDWLTPMYTPFIASIPGVLRYGYDQVGYAYYVTITNDEWGVQVLLAHMPADAQRRAGRTNGERVEAGELVGYSDNTGYSTGPHTHMEVRARPYCGYPCAFDFSPYLRQITAAPPPPPPPADPIKAGDRIQMRPGWRVRLGEQLTGATLDVTNQADTTIRPVVTRVVGDRVVFEVSIDKAGVQRVER